MKYCKKCGTPLGDNVRFCSKCGNKVDVLPPQKQTNLLPLVITLAVVLILSIATLMYFFFFKDNDKEASAPSASPSPSASMATPSPSPSPTPTPASDKIDMGRISSIIASDANHANISVCIKDLKTNTFYSTNNADAKMPASALTNIPILYVASKEMDYGNDSWPTQIKFTYRYSGRGNLTQSQSGSYMTLEYLLYSMLSYSDNNASNSLMDYYGKGYIESECFNYSYPSIEIGRYMGELNTPRDNYASARDLTSMLADLYTSSSTLGGDYLDNVFLIDDANRYNGIGKYLPSSASFLNHNGITSSIYNEAAIIRTGDSQYVITVLSNNGKTDSSAKTIADISSYVYDALN